MIVYPDKLEEYRQDAKLDAFYDALETCPSCDHRSLMITASWRASLTEPAGATGACLCRQWYADAQRGYQRVPLTCEECRDIHLDNLAMFTVPAESCDCHCHCDCSSEIG